MELGPFSHLYSQEPRPRVARQVLRDVLKEFLSIELIVSFYLDRGHPDSTLMAWKQGEKTLAGNFVHETLPPQRTVDCINNSH